MDMLTSPEFWLAVGQIILIDILLGGDNAVVIALACRKLPPNLRTKGILWGTAGAIVLRVVLIFFALTLLSASSATPSQSSSTLAASQTSVAPGLISDFVSSQSDPRVAVVVPVGSQHFR